VALADFKSVVPRDERGRWVRLPRTPANFEITTKEAIRMGGLFCCLVTILPITVNTSVNNSCVTLV